MRSLNQHLDLIRQSGTVAIADKIRQMEAEGKKIIPLHTGDPDFKTPKPLVESALKAIDEGLTHYANSRGLPELRKAICQNVLNRTGVMYNAETEVLVTNGGIHAYFLAISAIAGQGDEIIIPNPTWMSHLNIISLTGAVPVEVSVGEHNNFFYSASELESVVTNRTKGIVLNYPSNPTGRIPTAEMMSEVVEFAKKHDIYIISDEVYYAILFDGNRHTSVASIEGARERTITCNSFSKTYAMTGWRIGYITAPKAVLDQAVKVLQSTITNVAPFIQKAALTAMQSEEVQDYVCKMRTTYESRADAVIKLFEESPSCKVKINKPQGAFYFFVDIKSLNYSSSAEAAATLLNDYGVACVPGSVFGTGGEGYLRLTFASSTDNVMEGMKKFIQFASR